MAGCVRGGVADLTMKRLTSVFTRDYVRFALGSDVGSAEPLAVEEQDKELPELSREVDAVSVMEQDLTGLYPLLPLMRWEEGLRDDVLAALEVRFGAVPEALAEQVRRRQGRSGLEGLLRRAIVVESLEAFARELG